MAEIPVKKTGGFPVWAWIAALAILALLAFWLFAGGTDEYAEDETATETDYADTGTISTIAAIRSRDDLSSLDGRDAAFDGVDVTDVVGDRTFRIADGSGNDLFVVLDQVPSPDQPMVEGRYDINPGQTIDIEGELRIVENGRIDGERIEDMPRDTQLYLWADEVTILERS
ncbi:hypothetical protein [Aquisalinus flavus]|uniref:Uncharacterized protein n=1 Tax=Aquisalinus flavus TaxID=1526572 RepID=A0A8J2V6S9_9PROT|nr:hypothetical protein [Aquisalinus flavus]MBD0426821.1 hypothetical protein [Aquisalinus flavus]UNE46669.1 hypothetical protein FF099_00655 [Aquisalinus flavus]GGC96265.1 hypothetical protein GCM10011342_01340 [Aquisalinus flavus]